MKEITKKEFTGIFKEEFENFLRYKNALGYYKKIEGNLLYDYLALNRFLDSYKLEEIALTEEMTFAYVKTAEHLSQSTRHHRECNIRQFAKFLKSQGYENIYIQYDCTVKMPRDYIPYVFSNAEMKRIFSVIDSRESAYDRYDSRLFYQTLIRLLYCTGLRLGDDDDKIRLNQRKPSKYKGLRRFGPEKNLQRINKFMKERPIFYKNLIQMKENFRFYLRCFYCITKVVILQFNSEKQDRISS
ncbi:MAG: hypothetical protein ACLSAZ_16490 [Blautia wexlerae]